MILHWYHLYVLALGLLGLGATAADRAAVRIVLLAALASWALVDLVTAPLAGPWKLVAPAALEALTLLALLRWARTRTGAAQVVCVAVAWLAHALCFADLLLGSDVIYSHYEAMLAVVAAAQIAFCHDTILHHLRRVGCWWGLRRGRGRRALCAAGPASRLSPLPRPAGAAPLPCHPTTSTKP